MVGSVIGMPLQGDGCLTGAGTVGYVEFQPDDWRSKGD